jgi:PAS domain S-box-containing protein
MAEEADDNPAPKAKAGAGKGRHRNKQAHATHSQVRWVVYITFAIVAVVALGAAWNSMVLDERARREAAAVQRVTDARAEALELARLTALVLTANAERPRHISTLSRGVGHAAAAMPVVEQLLGGELRDAQTRRLFNLWRLAHERLRDRLAGLTGPALDLPPAENVAQLHSLLADADAASVAAQALTDRLKSLAQRSEYKAELTVWLQAALIVGLMVFMALLVIEPLVRTVQRRVASARGQVGPLKRLALVPEYTSAAVILTDRHDRIRWVNAAFTQTVGWRYEEVRHGLPAEVLRHPDAELAPLHTLREAVATGRPMRVESLHRKKDGSDIWLDLDVKPLRDRGGELRGFLYLARDISTQVAAQARQRLQWLSLPVGVVVHGPEGHVLDANREAERLLGRTRAQLIGQRLFDIGGRFVRSDLVVCQSSELPAERPLQTRAPVSDEVLGLRQADGSMRWLLVNTQPQLAADGTVSEVLVSWADISGRFKPQHLRAVGAA